MGAYQGQPITRDSVRALLRDGAVTGTSSTLLSLYRSRMNIDSTDKARSDAAGYPLLLASTANPALPTFTGNNPIDDTEIENYVRGIMNVYAQVKTFRFVHTGCGTSYYRKGMVQNTGSYTAVSLPTVEVVQGGVINEAQYDTLKRSIYDTILANENTSGGDINYCHCSCHSSCHNSRGRR